MVNFLARSMFRDLPHVPGSGRPVGGSNGAKDLKIQQDLGIVRY